MAALAVLNGLALRPHIKSHKSVEIARRQMALGAVGITTAKLSEAEVMARGGLRNLFVCYPLIGNVKLTRLRDLHREAQVMTVVDSEQGARGLSRVFAGEERPLDLLLKIDVGMHRVGVMIEEASKLADMVAALPGLRLLGVCIHEGGVYREPDPARRGAIAVTQTETLVSVAKDLRAQGHQMQIISTGSTPGARAASGVAGLTEMRPGNYVFYDNIQVSLGVTNLDHCALSVVTTVVSLASTMRGVLDAGSKALSLDRGAHGTNITSGYGVVRGRPGILIEKLSEEHGWLRVEAAERLWIGEVLDVIPNHACPVANNFEWAAVTKGDQVIDRWRIDARGCMT
ncbi:MAG: alanine racemase [Chloroflexota bacterium]|nr:alanine racemase [Chloroflexota bacterium]